MGRPWRRKNYFIKKELQGRYIFNFFIFVVIGSILFAIIFSLLSADTLTIVYKDSNLQIGKTPLILLKEILSAYWIFIVAGGLIVVIISMFLTHRVAGPLYRFERSLDEMIKGNLNFEIRLRKRDESKELAEMINRFNNILSSNLEEMRKLSDEVDSNLSSASKLVNEEAEQTSTFLGQAIAFNGRLKKILQRYKLKNE